MIYRITTRLTNDEWGGVVAVGLCLALPAFQYFTRTYWSYAVPLLLITLWFAIQRKYVQVGVFTGLTLLAHFSSLVPLGLLWLYLFFELYQARNWQTFLKCCLAVFAPIVVVELLFLAYYGPETPLLWTLGTLNALTNHSGVAYDPNLFWFPLGIVGSNGWLPALLLCTALGAAWYLRNNVYLQKIALMGLGVAAFYWTQGALGRGTLFTKAFTLLYPVWAILAAFVFVQIWKQQYKVQRYLQLGTVVFVWSIALSTALYMRSFTQTPQLVRAEVYQSYDYPVLAIGGSTIYTPAFYALHSEQETIYGTTADQWAMFVEATQPIIVNSGDSLVGQDLIGNYELSQSVDLQTPMNNRFPILNEEAGLDRTLEVWLPTSMQNNAHFQVDGATISPPGNFYPGTGCLSKKPYGNGTQYFYELVLERFF